MLTAVSLFAGIGGIDLALTRAGVNVVAAVEIDPACRKILKRHFPDVTLFDDVREVTGDQLRAAGFVPDRGILAGGWPCQDLSVAGRRVGMGEGTRSGLYWHVDRLVAELRPAWLLYENVPGLLSAVCPCPGTKQHDGCDEPHHVPGGSCPGGCMRAHGGAMGLVLGSLGDRGYGFAYRVLDAQYLGVPQRRRRVIFVGRAGGDARGPVQVLLEPEGGAGHPAPRREAQQDVAGTLGSRAGGSRTTDLDGHGTYIVGSLTTSSPGGIGGPDDNMAQAGHLIASAITAREGKGPDSDATTTLITETLRSHPRPGSNSVGAIVTHALTAEGADASEDGTGRGTPLVPMAFNPQTGGDVRIGYGDKPTALSRKQITAVQLPTAVRRLTPLECERLQGFPDGWTDEQSDAARYRQLGNSVAVPCIEWVTQRVVAVDAKERAS